MRRSQQSDPERCGGVWGSLSSIRATLGPGGTPRRRGGSGSRSRRSRAWGKVLARAAMEFDFYLATKHYAVHYLHATLGLPPRVIAEQMGWTLAGVLQLLAVYGHGDVGALEEIDRAFSANVRPLRTVAAHAPLPGRAMR